VTLDPLKELNTKNHNRVSILFSDLNVIISSFNNKNKTEREYF